MQTKNYRNQAFADAFEAIADIIPFEPKWSNKTGFFDFAAAGAHAPDIKPGHVMKCMTPGGRRMILIGTRLGNFVVFDRYANQGVDAPADGIYAFNTTSAFNEGCWFDGGSLSEGDLKLAFGEYGRLEYNIGWRLNQIYDSMKKLSK